MAEGQGELERISGEAQIIKERRLDCGSMPRVLEKDRKKGKLCFQNSGRSESSYLRAGLLKRGSVLCH